MGKMGSTRQIADPFCNKQFAPGMKPTVAYPPSLRRFAWLLALVLVCFAKPLFDWARSALHDELFSYVLLIPAVSVYLVWQKRVCLRWIGSENEPRDWW
jgi:hypothetical protein